MALTFKVKISLLMRQGPKPTLPGEEVVDTAVAAVVADITEDSCISEGLLTEAFLLLKVGDKLEERMAIRFRWPKIWRCPCGLQPFCLSRSLFGMLFKRLNNVSAECARNYSFSGELYVFWNVLTCMASGYARNACEQNMITVTITARIKRYFRLKGLIG